MQLVPSKNIETWSCRLNVKQNRGNIFLYVRKLSIFQKVAFTGGVAPKLRWLMGWPVGTYYPEGQCRYVKSFLKGVPSEGRGHSDMSKSTKLKTAHFSPSNKFFFKVPFSFELRMTSTPILLCSEWNNNLSNLYPGRNSPTYRRGAR